MPARFYRNRRAVLGKAKANPGENYVRSASFTTGTSTGILSTWLATVVIEDLILISTDYPTIDTRMKVAAPQSINAESALVMTHHDGAVPISGLNLIIPPNVREILGVGGERLAPGIVRMSVAAVVEDPAAAGPLKGTLSNTSASDATRELSAPPTNWSEWEKAVADDAQPPTGDILAEPKSKLPVVKRNRRRR